MADATRVALLARPGEACERLRAALREAGGEIVLEADPSTLAADTLSAAAPQTVLVALDPTVEDALDRFDAVLGDPNVAVIFDEAELAARREGWDAARWVRHLSAKLHRHDDVLPPGREPDGVAPEAAVTPAPDTSAVEPALTQGHVEGVAGHGLPPGPAEIIEDLPGLALEATPEIAFVADGGGDAMPQIEFGAHAGGEPIAEFESGADAGSEAAPDIASGTDAGSEVPAATGLELPDHEDAQVFGGLQLTDDIDAMSLEDDGAAQAFEGALDFEALVGGLEPVDTRALDAGLDELLASAPEVPMDVVADLPPLEDAPASAPAPDAPPKVTFDFGALSLVDQDDAPPAAQAPGQGGRFQHDIADLERRIASMGLSDGPEAAPAAPAPAAPAPPPPEPQADAPAPVVPAAPAAHADQRAEARGGGAVLILAGIGGPDAVRQILSALPATFARPVLISQRLDGGRYDRLVQQMGRAAALPVQLAQAGDAVHARQVYIVPPELGLEDGEGLRFVAGARLLDALPADDSAVLLLSGADPAQVEHALAKSAEGALVAGQSPEGCYDAAAPVALTTRGGAAGTPPELVQRLLQRWPA